MNLYEAFVKINSIEPIKDIAFYIDSVCNKTLIQLKGNRFYIHPKSSKDKFMAEIILNDIVRNSHSWRYTEVEGLEIFYQILKSIDIELIGNECK